MPPSRQTPAPSADPVSPDHPAAPLGADDFLASEDILERQRRRRWVIALVALALMVGGGFAAKPALHAIKAWQARRAAAEAERLTNEHQWYEAKNKLQDALQFWRQEPAAQRAAAIFLSRTGNVREAATFWKQVEAARPLTTDEQREYAAALLGAGDLDAAEDHLRKAWPAGRAGTPADWELGLQIARRRNQVPEMLDLAKRLLADPLTTGRQRLAAALTLLASGAPDAQDKALDEILKLARDQKSPESLDALVILVQNAANFPGGVPPARSAGEEPFPTLAELIARVESHALAKIQQRLLTLDVQIAREPARRAEYIQTAIDRFGGSKDDADLAVLGGWLYSKKEYEKVLELIPAARAFGERALFSQRFDALAALDRWSEVREAIQSRKIVLDPMLEQMYLARCAEKLNEPRVRDARWDAAMDAAGGKLEKLLQLGQYARTDGALDVAEKAFRAVIQAAPESREAYSALAGILAASGKTAKLRELLALMTTIWPDDAAVQNDVAYFDALLNENVPAALKIARELVRAAPASLPHRVTLALAELRTGNNLAALDAFNGIASPSKTIAEPRQKAVYAAALWATSYNDEAREVLRGVSLEHLLPEERILVAPIQPLR